MYLLFSGTVCSLGLAASLTLNRDYVTLNEKIDTNFIRCLKRLSLGEKPMLIRGHEINSCNII